MQEKGNNTNFYFNVTLNSGTCEVNITDSSGAIVCTNVIDSSSIYEKQINLSNLVDGEYNITMQTNENTDGKIQLVVTENIKNN